MGSAFRVSWASFGPPRYTAGIRARPSSRVCRSTEAPRAERARWTGCRASTAGAGGRVGCDERGKRQSETFRYRRDAELFERRRKAEAEEIARGLRPGPPPEKTFGQLCDYWIENRASQKRSGHHDESIIRAHLRPAFGAFMLHEIGVVQIDKFIVDRAHLSRKTVANHLTLLGAIFNLARDLGCLPNPPRLRKPRVRVFAADFSFLRSADEIRRFLTAARSEGDEVFAIYATAVFTGLRAGELAGCTGPMRVLNSTWIGGRLRLRCEGGRSPERYSAAAVWLVHPFAFAGPRAEFLRRTPPTTRRPTASRSTRAMMSVGLRYRKESSPSTLEATNHLALPKSTPSPPRAADRATPPRATCGLSAGPRRPSAYNTLRGSTRARRQGRGTANPSTSGIGSMRMRGSAFPSSTSSDAWSTRWNSCPRSPCN